MHKDYMVELEELRLFLSWFLKKDLLEELVSLQELLNHSVINRYKDICDNSEHKGNCGFAAKAKELFEKIQERPITEKIEYIYKNFVRGMISSSSAKLDDYKDTNP